MTSEAGAFLVDYLSTVSVAFAEEEPRVPVIVVEVVFLTAWVVMVNFADDEPDAMVTVAGTCRRRQAGRERYGHCPDRTARRRIESHGSNRRCASNHRGR